MSLNSINYFQGTDTNALLIILLIISFDQEVCVAVSHTNPLLKYYDQRSKLKFLINILQLLYFETSYKFNI